MALNEVMVFIVLFFQLHPVSRTQQGREREPSVKTHRSPLSANFWRHCVLSGRIQRRTFPSTPERRKENINVNKYFISSSGDRTHNQSIYRRTLCTCTNSDCKTDWFKQHPRKLNIYLNLYFDFFCSGIEIKRGVEICHSTRNDFRTRQKVGNGVSLN